MCTSEMVSKTYSKQERPIILAADTIIEVLAMVIEIVDALVAQLAVFAGRMNPALAKRTPTVLVRRRRAMLRVGRSSLFDSQTSGQRKRVVCIEGGSLHHEKHPGAKFGETSNSVFLILVHSDVRSRDLVAATHMTASRTE